MKKVLFIMMLFCSLSCMGQNSNVINVTTLQPTLGTAADSVGWIVGGIQTITNATKFPGYGGRLVSITATDKSNVKPALDVYFFSQRPDSGTYTNHTAFVADSTDMHSYLGRVRIAAADWVTISTYATYTSAVYNFATYTSGTTTSIYAIIVATALYTPTTTKDLVFKIGTSQN